MNKEYMKAAYKEALKAYKNNEVPVGAVIVKNDNIISRAYNKVEKEKDATKHAEIIAISKASKKLNNWRLNDCDLYVTLEPCMMCKTAIELARIRNVYYCINKIETDLFKSNFNKIEDYKNESLKLLKTFFKEKR